MTIWLHPTLGSHETADTPPSLSEPAERCCRALSRTCEPATAAPVVAGLADEANELGHRVLCILGLHLLGGVVSIANRHRRHGDGAGNVRVGEQVTPNPYRGPLGVGAVGMGADRLADIRLSRCRR